MARTTGIISVDPQGRSVVVDITGPAGAGTFYTAESGATAHTLPLTITTVTEFYVTTPADYAVSAKIGDHECLPGGRGISHVGRGCRSAYVVGMSGSDAGEEAGGGSAASGPLSTLLYGTGQDGAVVLADGDQINTGMYTDFTIPAGATVTPNINWAPAPSPLANSYYAIPVVFCTGTFTIGGTVDLRGVDGVDYQPLAQFVQGGHQGAGSADAMTGPYPGGHGGAGSAGAGDTMRLSRAMITPIRLLTALSGAEMGGSLYLEYENSGGGGAGDNTNYGGAGGVPGSGLVIVARHIVHADTNSYLLTGGKGADGGWDGAGGGPGLGDCGGGGGGGGGWWMTVCDDIVGSANLVGHGGAGGAGCGSGTAGGAGTDGQGIHYTPSGVIIQNPA